MNNLFPQKPLNALKTGIGLKWHKIGECTGMKRTMAFRIITVAIGVLVAMVIAITLWIGVPTEPETDSAPARASELHSMARNLLKVVYFAVEK